MDVRYDYSSADGGLDTMGNYDEMLNRTFYDYEEDVIPAVGRKVYVVSIDSKQVCEEEVYALGKESFLLVGFRDYKKDFGELYYRDYYSRWFLDANEALAHLSKYLTDDERLEEEGFDGIWNVVKL